MTAEESNPPFDERSLLAEANAELSRLAQRLIVVRESERGLIARELHDDVQQILVGLRMSMEAVAKGRVQPTAVSDVQSWIPLLQEAIDHLHELTATLHRPQIGINGLGMELRAHISHLALLDGQKINLHLELGAVDLGPGIELACFRIVQEALANVIKHSRAMHIDVRLKQSDRDLLVSVDDDGVGFDVPFAQAHASRAGRIGLESMRERAALAGGRLEVHSSVGHGTYVRGCFTISRSAS